MSAVALSIFWSRLDWLLILAALFLVVGSAVLGAWLGWWLRGRHETAAGDGDSPADGAAPMAGSSITAAVPAPAASTTSPVGAAGVTPFGWFDADPGRDRREAEQAAEVEAITGGGR